ncbi:RNA-directed DNA polymerase, eukaryota, reverse transcriptase zinc-binding domain protein [Tanacetum coccineum]
MNSNDLSDIYEYYTRLDMEQYTQYLEYFEQYEAMEEDEAESSEKQTRRYIARDREMAEDKLRRDYFGDENTPPVYPEEYFRRRYRMSSTLFKKIVHDISNYNVDPLPDYFLFFKQRPDATGRLGFSALLKCTRLTPIGYGSSDLFDVETRASGNAGGIDCIELGMLGVLGANNDLNVLYGSPLFDDLLADKAPEAPFQVNEKTYEKGYYLADGIYPQ